MRQRILLATVLMIGLPAPVQAQYGNRNNRMPTGGQPVEIHGTLQNMGRGTIVVLDSTSNQPSRVALMPGTNVHVTGTAAPNNLRSGMIVEFTAQVDNRGTVQQKVDSLTITSPK